MDAIPFTALMRRTCRASARSSLRRLRPLREIVPDIPEGLESVILRCLEKQPSERYSSAAELREGLKTIVKTLQLDQIMMPGEGAINMPVQQRLDMEDA